MKESGPENNPSTVDEIYEILDSKGRLAVDSARELVRQFLEKGTVKGLKEALDSSQLWKDGFYDNKDLGKEVGKLLSAEIKQQFKEKKEIAIEKKETKKPGSAAEIFKASQKKEEELKRMLQKDSESVVAAKQELESVYESELSQEQREILEEVDKRGRLATMTAVGTELGRDRGVSSGFQDIVDRKSENDSTNRRLKDLMTRGRIYSVNNSREILEKEGVNASIEIDPLMREESIYEEKIIEKGILFWKTKEKVSEKVGVEKKPVLIGDLNGDNGDQERAYRIFYYVQGGKEGNEYLDPGTGRHGVIFQGHIMLPESIAKKTFGEIKKDPSFVKKVLRTLDPKLMEEQESPPAHWSFKGRGPMPKVNKVLIIPEGADREDIFDIDKSNRNIASGIRQENIKECLGY